jgi:hypothetical protein
MSDGARRAYRGAPVRVGSQSVGVKKRNGNPNRFTNISVADPRWLLADNSVMTIGARFSQGAFT